jgi:predicted NUDIX family NTP pyrophosphohydrolase
MKQSAGILLYKKVKGELFLLLAHPGGPFWKNKDLGTWTIPKGEFTEEETAFDAAIREFREETGISLSGEFIELKSIKQKSGKVVYAWALEKEVDVTTIKSNVIEIEWPPKSGKKITIPEIEKTEWFTVDQATKKIIPAQQSFITQLVENNKK